MLVQALNITFHNFIQIAVISPALCQAVRNAFPHELIPEKLKLAQIKIPNQILCRFGFSRILKTQTRNKMEASQIIHEVLKLSLIKRRKTKNPFSLGFVIKISTKVVEV